MARSFANSAILGGVEGEDQLRGGRQVAGDDAGAHHFAIAQHWSAGQKGGARCSDDGRVADDFGGEIDHAAGMDHADGSVVQLDRDVAQIGLGPDGGEALGVDQIGITQIGRHRSCSSRASRPGTLGRVLGPSG